MSYSLADVRPTTSGPVEAFVAVLRKLGYVPQKGKAGKTYAKECCTNTFASFSSPRMSSSSYYEDC